MLEYCSDVKGDLRRKLIEERYNKHYDDFPLSHFIISKDDTECPVPVFMVTTPQVIFKVRVMEMSDSLIL